MITIKEIAQQAGFSPSTVSRLLSNDPSLSVSPETKQKILNNVHNGEIMLLHGNSKTNTNILDSIIKQIKQMGYEFKSLDEFE